MRSLDLASIRKQFPILSETVHGKPLVYLDNAATTQKPARVIEAVAQYYMAANSNVHRGVHALSEKATQAYEGARKKVQSFLGARSEREIIFVRGATEGINLVASSLGRGSIETGDEIIVTAMEHHSNIVPWQMLCEERGAKLRVWPMNDRGELVMEELPKLLNKKTRLLAMNHISNALGTVNPVRAAIRMAREAGALTLIDGAQAAPHLKIDVRELDCDFYVISGHKVYGPTGIGALYGRGDVLERLPPYQGGGDMIRSVSFEKTTYSDLPYKFEAGTPHISGAVGLAEALDFVTELGLDAIAAHEKALLEYATKRLSEIPGVRLIGTAREKASVVSFVIEGIHPHDVGTILDQEGIAIRTGHHCAQPVMTFFKVPATARVSFALYNTRDEIDALMRGLMRVKEMFA